MGGCRYILYFKSLIKGHDKYNSLSRLYLRNASGVIVVTDITNHDSLETAVHWLEKIKENEDSMKNINTPIILFQNKFDLISSEDDVKDFRKNEEIKDFARKHGFIDCLEVSTKSKYNLEEGIEILVKEILKFENQEINEISETRGETMVNVNLSPKESLKLQTRKISKGKKLVSSDSKKQLSKKPTCACLC